MVYDGIRSGHATSAMNKQKKNRRNEDARLQYFIVSRTKKKPRDRELKYVYCDVYVLAICIGMECGAYLIFARDLNTVLCVWPKG